MNLGAQLLFFFVLAVLLPRGGWRSRQLMMSGARLLPRPNLYYVSMTSMGLLLMLTIAVAHATHVHVAFGAITPRGALYGAAALALLVSYALLRARSGKVDPMTLMLVPRTNEERMLLAILAAAASVAEELAYRGLAFALLQQWLGNVAAAAIVAALLFGLGHLFQGPTAAALTIVFALIAQTLVIVTGGLTIAIVVHFAYDVIVAFALGANARALTTTS